MTARQNIPTARESDDSPPLAHSLPTFDTYEISRRCAKLDLRSDKRWI